MCLEWVHTDNIQAWLDGEAYGFGVDRMVCERVTVETFDTKGEVVKTATHERERWVEEEMETWGYFGFAYAWDEATSALQRYGKIETKQG